MVLPRRHAYRSPQTCYPPAPSPHTSQARHQGESSRVIVGTCFVVHMWTMAHMWTTTRVDHGASWSTCVRWSTCAVVDGNAEAAQSLMQSRAHSSTLLQPHTLCSHASTPTGAGRPARALMHMLERYGFDEKAAPHGACLLKRTLRPRGLAWTGEESATPWMRRIDIDRHTHRQT